MPHPAAIPTPPAGRSFVFATTLLAAVALGLAVAAAAALVRGLDLPGQLPPQQPASTQAPPSAHLERPATAPPIAHDLYTTSLTPPPQVTAPPVQRDLAFRPGALLHPEILELVEIAAAFKNEGDTAAALNKLREANRRLPDQPRVLWELAAVFRAMALDEKADAELAKLRALGPAAGGEYFELANLALDDGTAAAQAHRSPDFSFGKTLLSIPPDDGTGGERVLVRLAIHSLLADAVPPNDISLVMEFYDLVDGDFIEETRSDPPVARWPTAPVDWGDAGIEIVEWEYHMPRLAQGEPAAFGQRRYYGYVARLFYKDRLQDVYAEPRTLLARPAAAAAPSLLDASLFPGP